jgi:large subunit ribosomal protein L18
MTTTMRTVPYRRKREDKTNYKKRLKLLLGNKPRLVVRKALKNILVQLVEYSPQGDHILAVANSTELKKYGWTYNRGNLPSAYLTGVLLSKKALATKQKEGILDIGLQNPRSGTRLYAALKGVVDAGLNVPHDPACFPKEERIKGLHIANNPLLKEKGKDIPNAFQQCKEKILKG